MGEKIGVVLPAAGSGSRFGEDKLMFDLLGKPVLWHTVNAFQEAGSVSSIVIATRRESLCFVRELTSGFTKVVAVVEGGKSRRESVLRGVDALPADVAYVSVHDAARPLILPEEIDRIHRKLPQYGAICAAFPVYDTVHQVDGKGYIVATPDRETLIAAATPQAFSLELYKKACSLEGEFTDDAQMVCAAGSAVKTVLCRGENFKITTKEDAFRAQQVVLCRQGK